MYKLKDNYQLILASASPRRKELLEQAGLKFITKEANIDEAAVKIKDPIKLVETLSLLKAENVAANNDGKIIIGADTVVYFQNQILGKPKDKSEAKKMLSLLQGNTHFVYSAFAIIFLEQKIVRSFETRVSMRKLTNAEIDVYVKTQEPLDKAGSYAIQGIGASLVSTISGSYTNVVGLNITGLIESLLELGVISCRSAAF